MKRMLILVVLLAMALMAVTLAPAGATTMTLSGPDLGVRVGVGLWADIYIANTYPGATISVSNQTNCTVSFSKNGSTTDSNGSLTISASPTVSGTCGATLTSTLNGQPNQYASFTFIGTKGAWQIDYTNCAINWYITISGSGPPYVTWNGTKYTSSAAGTANGNPNVGTIATYSNAPYGKALFQGTIVNSFTITWVPNPDSFPPANIYLHLSQFGDASTQTVYGMPNQYAAVDVKDYGEVDCFGSTDNSIRVYHVFEHVVNGWNWYNNVSVTPPAWSATRWPPGTISDNTSVHYGAVAILAGVSIESFTRCGFT